MLTIWDSIEIRQCDKYLNILSHSGLAKRSDRCNRVYHKFICRFRYSAVLSLPYSLNTCAKKSEKSQSAVKNPEKPAYICKTYEDLCWKWAIEIEIVFHKNKRKLSHDCIRKDAVKYARDVEESGITN